jgi:hypothetical protein
MLTNEFCVRGKFWEKDPHTHSPPPPPLSVVGVSNTLGGAHATYSIGFGHFAVAQYIFQLGKMIL